MQKHVMAGRKKKPSPAPSRRSTAKTAGNSFTPARALCGAALVARKMARLHGTPI